MPLLAGLPLRDIHQPPAPSLWPPAPGWWLLVAALLLTGALAWWWRRRILQRRRAIARLFDDAVSAAPTPALQLAAASELLRRAARRVDPQADALEGEDWLALLDRGHRQHFFTGETGALLLEGGYRPDVDAEEAAPVLVLARERFVGWMERGR